VSDVAPDLLPLSRVFAGTVAGPDGARRLFPIAVVVVPLLALQMSFSHDAMAMPIGILMAAVFLLVAPTLWRYFFRSTGRAHRGCSARARTARQGSG